MSAASAAKWYQANRDRALLRMRDNYLLHRDERKKRARERGRVYYSANREQVIAKVKDYYRTHRAQIVAKTVVRNRLRRAAMPRLRIYKGGVMATGQSPKLSSASSILAPPDRDWWKLKESEIPRRWIMEAAA